MAERLVFGMVGIFVALGILIPDNVFGDIHVNHQDLGMPKYFDIDRLFSDALLARDSHRQTTVVELVVNIEGISWPSRTGLRYPRKDVLIHIVRFPGELSNNDEDIISVIAYGPIEGWIEGNEFPETGKGFRLPVNQLSSVYTEINLSFFAKAGSIFDLAELRVFKSATLLEDSTQLSLRNNQPILRSSIEMLFPHSLRTANFVNRRSSRQSPRIYRFILDRLEGCRNALEDLALLPWSYGSMTTLSRIGN